MGESTSTNLHGQPVSIHKDSSHPVAIAAAVVFVPILVCIVAGALLLVNSKPKDEGSLALAQTEDLSSSLLEKHQVINANNRLAVCNDGSPATYYYRPGRLDNVNKWIVFLEGGGSCDTNEACEERYTKDKHRVSSLNYPEVLSPRGILDDSAEENSDFWNFNHVYIKYCSSDNWSGDTSHVINDETVEFRGNKIVTAVLEDLGDDTLFPDHNLDEASAILLTGSGSGGVGVAHNLDRVASLFPRADVRGVSDSAWRPDIAGLDHAPSPAQYWNSQLDDSCYVGQVGNPPDCYDTDATYPFLATPMFVFMDQSDRSFLEALGPSADENIIGDTVRASLEPVAAAFSPNEGVHTALTAGRFTSLSINGDSYAEVLGNWYFKRAGTTKAVAE